ncbi:hypothetical protein PAAG_03967 [Paracoccidioides lutzii Pb01]|uniref:Uncharacterized protein n=1 Tax=Paracoccidioides lutzii (strain ATCC MYA-826 / Pb01) TaxID=502779 RepID=C1GZM3_PARBA|nr:hypothetical protein PAAG_03967 [Paracoccidioides lutzii Pb01]EEH42046.2 hypothetical protein PAAG_03967 [Paracoccidioides lutzii Pb01]
MAISSCRRGVNIFTSGSYHQLVAKSSYKDLNGITAHEPGLQLQTGTETGGKESKHRGHYKRRSSNFFAATTSQKYFHIAACYHNGDALNPFIRWYRAVGALTIIRDAFSQEQSGISWGSLIEPIFSPSSDSVKGTHGPYTFFHGSTVKRIPLSVIVDCDDDDGEIQTASHSEFGNGLMSRPMHRGG